MLEIYIAGHLEMRANFSNREMHEVRSEASNFMTDNNNNPILNPSLVRNTPKPWGANYPHAGGGQEGPTRLPASTANGSSKCELLI